jgi:GT2 family glycosyltransferase
MKEIKNIAVLMTCHNRKNKTLLCLEKFFEAINPDNHNFDVYLTDDGSTDGTSVAVEKEYPNVNIIKGNGNLFWNKGMRLAWKTAACNKKYDFYLWLNDDTNLDTNAIYELFDSYSNFLKAEKKECIVVSACRNIEGKDVFSYGLRNNHVKVIPNGITQKGNMMNGNFVLIPDKIFQKLGFLSENYTHAMGDYDYGLRAIENNFELITTKNYIATCALNEGLPVWCDPQNKFSKRWRFLNSPLGLNIKEYKMFRKRFWPKNYILSISKVYFKCFFPNTYNFFQNARY